MSGSDIAALVVVAACVVWVLWRVWRRLQRKDGCGCDHCPTKDDGPTKPG